MKFYLKWFRVVELWVQCRFTDWGPLVASNLSSYGFFINPPTKNESWNIPRIPWGSPKFKSVFPGHSGVWGDHQWNNLVKFSLISVFHFGDSQSTDKDVQSTLISIYKKYEYLFILFFSWQCGWQLLSSFRHPVCLLGLVCQFVIKLCAALWEISD